jgi:hypothetical protein
MKAKFGAIVVAGSGKIGGHVASRNRAGAYFRTKVSPVNPQTSYQLTSRARLAGWSQSWRDLADDERQAWNAAVSAWAKTDVFGDIKNPTGFNLFVRLNTNAEIAGGGLSNFPPTPEGVSVAFATALTAAAGTPTLSLVATTPVPANTAYKVWATPGQSVGKKFVKSEYRLISVLAPAAASPFNILAAYTSRFGALVEGTRVFVKIQAVNQDTGGESSASEISDIVAA